jgi:nucleotide-binding universal stress UspA family protein
LVVGFTWGPTWAHDVWVSAFATSILVATDLSEASYAGLAEAARLCGATSCHVRLLYVFDVAALALPPALARSENTLRRIAEEATGAAFSVLLGLRERFFSGFSGVDVCTIEHDGAAAGICTAAARFGVDLIVLTSAGRGSGGEASLGSITERVLRQAPCRVLVVPPERGEAFSH